MIFSILLIIIYDLTKLYCFREREKRRNYMAKLVTMNALKLTYGNVNCKVFPKFKLPDHHPPQWRPCLTQGEEGLGTENGENGEEVG